MQCCLCRVPVASVEIVNPDGSTTDLTRTPDNYFQVDQGFTYPATIRITDILCACSLPAHGAADCLANLMLPPIRCCSAVHYIPCH